MVWSEIDLDAGVWKIPGPRTNNAHTVTLSGFALDILRETPRGPCKFVLSLTGGRAFASFDQVKKRLDALLPDEMEHWTLHDLRRTMASGCARLGIAPHVIETMLNHRSGVIKGIARVYNRHSYAEESRAAFSLWGNHIDELIHGADLNVISIRRG